jgi:threonine/homoserine/homoserine lactone efflux protein
MGGMRKFLLAVRMIAEGILGLFVLLTLPISLLKALAERANLAYMLGTLVGMILMLFLAVWLVKDAARLISRLKSPSPPIV